MKLFFIRHGESEDLKAGNDDESRVLTDTGKKETVQLAKILSRLGGKPDAIIVSPLTRAIQTAAVIAKKIKYKQELLVFDGLKPDARTDALIEFLRHNKEFKRAYIIGHQPFLGQFIAKMTGCGKAPDVAKSSVYLISLDFTETGFSAVIDGYITPCIAKKLV